MSTDREISEGYNYNREENSAADPLQEQQDVINYSLTDCSSASLGRRLGQPYDAS
jgi:hypothetical protein